MNGFIRDREIGYIFSKEEYARAAHGNLPWYQAAGQDYFNYTPIFIGLNLREPLLAAELQRYKSFGSKKEGRGCLITPDTPSPLQAAAQKTQNIEHLKGTLSEFVLSLKQSFPVGLTVSDIEKRQLQEEGVILSGLDAVDQSDRIKLSSFLVGDAGYMRKRYYCAPEIETKRESRRFYLGFGPTRFIIANELHCKLEAYEGVYAAVEEFTRSSERLFVIFGQAGSGKSTCILDAMEKVSTSNPQYKVLHFVQRYKPIIDSFKALAKVHPEEKKFVVVDDLHVFSEYLGEVLNSSWAKNIAIFSSARLGEWHSRLERQLGRGVTHELRRFSLSDAARLVQALTSNVPAPALQKLSPSERVEKFLRSRRQLLIAMKEAVGGGEFNTIIEDEYASLGALGTRMCFLIVAVATLARVGITKAQLRQIWPKVDNSSELDDCLAALSGIVELGANGRLAARHELYVRHLIDKRVDVDEVRDAFVHILNVFSGYTVHVIRQSDKSDGQ